MTLKLRDLHYPKNKFSALSGLAPSFFNSQFWEADISKKMDMVIHEMNVLQAEFEEVEGNPYPGNSNPDVEQQILDRLCSLFGGSLHHSGGGIWLALFDCGRYYLLVTDESLSLNEKPEWAFSLAPDCLDQLVASEKKLLTLAEYDFSEQKWWNIGNDTDGINTLIFASVIVSNLRPANKFKFSSAVVCKHWPFLKPHEWIEGLYNMGLLTLEGLEHGEPEDMKKDGKPILTKIQARWMRSKFIECGRLMGTYEAFEDMAEKLINDLEKQKEVK